MQIQDQEDEKKTETEPGQPVQDKFLDSYSPSLVALSTSSPSSHLYPDEPEDSPMRPAFLSSIPSAALSRPASRDTVPGRDAGATLSPLSVSPAAVNDTPSAVSSSSVPVEDATGPPMRPSFLTDIRTPPVLKAVSFDQAGLTTSSSFDSSFLSSISAGKSKLRIAAPMTPPATKTSGNSLLDAIKQGKTLKRVVSRPTSISLTPKSPIGAIYGDAMSTLLDRRRHLENEVNSSSSDEEDWA